ncbi:MAG TPA: DUF433 domain-containing protein [Chitinophagales bacterium]|jgi:uncharacterized protein (DUF433 family)|nr:DUF433 domain-containing protein [Chitinophagales bacterium]
MIWQTHIDSDPKILFGKPKIKGTRISVDLILERLANKYSFQEILQAYPSLTEDAIYACLQYASESVKNEILVA